MRAVSIAVRIVLLMLAAGPVEAATFQSTDRLIRVHVDDGQAPGVTDETTILDQLGDLVDTREASVLHEGAGAYASQARAEHQSSVGGAAVTFAAELAVSGTSEEGGPNAIASTRLEVDFDLSISESFTLSGEYDLELGDGEVSLQVQLLGGGVSFLSASGADLFEDHGLLAYSGTLEPGSYTFVVDLFALDENRVAGLDLGGASVSLRNLGLFLEPVNVPEPGTAPLVALGLAAVAFNASGAGGRRRCRGRCAARRSTSAGSCA
jgi:hypothetical protein